MPRVLIVDDREAFSAFVRVVAAGCGYEAKVLLSQEVFESVLSAWQPDIIVLDIMMPERDGIELISALAKQAYRGQLILVTGAEQVYMDMAIASVRAHNLRLSASLRKPCRAKTLGQELRKAAAAVQSNEDARR